MDFQHLKMSLIKETGLEKDALHIYVGMAVYLISLILTCPMIAKHLTRHNIAVIMTTLIAMLGEYLDLRIHSLPLSSAPIAASIHDLINTCLWPYVLYAIHRWTPLFKSGDSR